MKAIVIDDDPSVLSILATVLKRRGYEVDCYSDPSQCPLFSVRGACPCECEERCPDLILTDMVMPNVGGMEFVEKLRAMGCLKPRIVMMSGYWMHPDDLSKVKDFGAEFLSKPFRLSQINDFLDCFEKK